MPKSDDSVQIPLWTIVTLQRRAGDGDNRVQIPLWTIVTRSRVILFWFISCSDSSMDDCNLFANVSNPRTLRSDSSMDDCNVVCKRASADIDAGSDSSMDDCNFGHSSHLRE